ncbi:MAG: transcriptional repressor LexA [Bacteroidales bacterium]|jgi:site-specific DNA-methyltransferase (adenine-specific)|nr:transcriptional repressor LexA [Bacteroidales bacterium]
MLTKKQKKVLEYIESYTQKHGFSPSHDEIRKHLKLSSVSTVNHYMKILQEKGYIKRGKNIARSVEVDKKESIISIPFKGYIAAGMPIEAVEEFETISVPSGLVSVGEHFALGIKGNSMIDEGIFDGDTVIIRKQNSVEDGETAVALINDNEVTLKKIFREKNRIRLQPANPNLKPFYVKEVIIQGKVISTFRNLEEKEKKDEKFKFNQFLCGDVLDMMKKIPDSSIHFAVTSPPYNVGKDYDNHNDKMKHQDYLDWLYKVWEETKRVLVPGGRFAINIAPTGIRDFVAIHHDYIEQMKKLGMKFRTEILWYKQTMLKRTAWGSFKSPANPHIVPSWEYVLIFTKDQDRLDGDPKMADITKEEFMQFSDGFWKIKPETQRKGHPAPFPEDLIYRLMKFYSYKGNNVLDMFGGTGTVAVIAERTGRNFVHIDISPQYCKVASDRLENEKLQKKLL